MLGSNCSIKTKKSTLFTRKVPYLVRIQSHKSTDDLQYTYFASQLYPHIDQYKLNRHILTDNSWLSKNNWRKLVRFSCSFPVSVISNAFIRDFIDVKNKLLRQRTIILVTLALYFTHQNGPPLEDKTDLLRLQCMLYSFRPQPNRTDNSGLTYPALHFPQTAFLVVVQGLIVSSLGSQMVHGLHEDKSCLSEYTSPSLHCTHCTVTSAVTRDPHCGTNPWPSGHSGQFKHSTPAGRRMVSWFHLHLLPDVTCAKKAKSRCREVCRQPYRPSREDELLLVLSWDSSLSWAHVTLIITAHNGIAASGNEID